MNKEYILTTPNQALENIRDFLRDNDWTIMNNCTPNLAIDAGIGDVPEDYYDGLVLAAKKGDVIVVMRSVNGLRVLPTQNKTSYTWADDVNNEYNFLNRTLSGIVITSCTYYSSNPPSGLWYDQINAITNENDDVIGVFLPIQNVDKILKYSDDEYYRKYTQKMIINYTDDPEISCIISMEYIAVDMTSRTNGVEPHMFTSMLYGTYDIAYRKLYSHAAFSYIQKIGTWIGGACISGTLNSSMTGVLKDVYATVNQKLVWLGCVIKHPTSYIGKDNTSSNIDAKSNLLYGMSKDPSTFCRIDVDGAPLRERPILWAAAGPRTGTTFSTGKTLALPIATKGYFSDMPGVPHFCNIQSQNNADTGRNANTLNDISVDLPLYAYILRDPDVLENYSQIGYIPNVYAITMKNIAEGKKYKFNYPEDEEHQVFPHVCRRSNVSGYDGFAILQEEPIED